jgi:methionyl-tRNA synthetase
LDIYSGWYNIREETFVTESDAALSDFKDPTSGLPLKKVDEESYFFKMSRYQDRLITHIEENPQFIRPEKHRNLILSRLRAEPLRDLSISRTTFSWGIDMPDGFKEGHVMYVWIDALSNYLTGVDALKVTSEGTDKSLEKFWPANVHIIGKDILWFHTVIWPCLLMSADIHLPKTVFAHGFVNDKEGKKMSKSMGNVVDPHDMLDKYPVDTFRWYVCKEAPYGGELSFSEDSLRAMHNSDLCDILGNLVHRATNLCHKYCNGVVPDVSPPQNSPIDFSALMEQYQNKMENYELESGASIAISGFRDVNGYLTSEAPWLKKGDEYSEIRQISVRATLEAIYALTHFLTPFLPCGAAVIFKKLGTAPKTLSQIRKDCRNLKVGTPIGVGDVLYPKLLSEEETLAISGASKKKESHHEAQQRKKEKQAQNIAASQAGQKEAALDQSEFTKIEIRVGQIVKVWNHPDADKLFCEEIDIGEESGARLIASGLREHYSLEEMLGKKVLVVCNLKAAKIVGFNSNGMVLAAKGEGKVELVTPPDDAPIGERVFIDGLTGEPATSAQVKKKKIWETVAKELRTTEQNVASWEGKEILTTTGKCTVLTLKGAPIA